VNRRIRRSRSRVGWCAFSARLLRRWWCLVCHARQHLPPRRAVTGERVGDERAWHVLHLLAQSTPRRDQAIAHVARLVDHTPQVVPHPVAAAAHLVEMPLVTGLRPPLPAGLGVPLAALPAPLAHRLVRQDHAALGERKCQNSVQRRKKSGESDEKWGSSRFGVPS